MGLKRRFLFLKNEDTVHFRHAILIWRQVDDTNGQCRLHSHRDIVDFFLDYVSYKLLVFLRLQQELDTEPAEL